MANEIPQWFRAAITTGIQGLVVLSLPRTPAGDVIVATASRWCQLLWKGRIWIEQRDQHRLAIAFDQLAINSDEWPTPKKLITFLPPHQPPQLLPPPPSSPEEKARQKQLLNKLLTAVGADAIQKQTDSADNKAQIKKPDMSQIMEQMKRAENLEPEQLEQLQNHPNVHPLVKAHVRQLLKQLRRAS